VRSLDVEGRVVLARFGRLTVVNAYFPKGSGTQRDNSRVPLPIVTCSPTTQNGPTTTSSANFALGWTMAWG